MSILQKIFDPNAKEVARLKDRVTAINAFEPQMEQLSDSQLAAKSGEFRNRLAEGASLDDLLPEAFAVVREVSVRTLKMRQFDVQLLGGIVLHQGKIAEMKTGEGKTLAATLPIVLNALTGRGVHVVTVNPYLARRDAEWMGPIYEFLGLSVGVIVHGQSREEKQAAYNCDITYVHNTEIGFDYLRDNMALSREYLVQRELHYAIVDEVDSILVDEARTPLIISGMGTKPTELYSKVDRIIASLTKEKEFTIDEKAKTAMLTEEGTPRVEKVLGIDNLTDPENLELAHHVNAALRARYCYKRDVDYVVKDGEVVIVDEFTGRLLPGRVYGEGLHQAIEAKEGVSVKQESQTVATITYQNFFRLYEKLAGMTGTAKTEEAEFVKIYNLPVIMVPTNLPMVRKDHADVVYKSEEAKFRGLTLEILETHARGQPVLVGTRSIETSERVSARLLPDRLQTTVLTVLLQARLRKSNGLDGDTQRRYREILMRPVDSLTLGALRPIARALDVPPDPLAADSLKEVLDLGEGDGEVLAAAQKVLSQGIPHNVLNARHHEKEAHIIAQAGRVGAVTVATNMAGRGVDIVLGGNPAQITPEGEVSERDHEEWQEEHNRVVALGGLHITGSERHESRRIDNQLRGRSGRQGDPGSSRFYLSLEDELWRLFGGERLVSWLGAWPEEEPIVHKWISAGIENAQKKVEAHNFEIRKSTLRYDDVMNTQRVLIYSERRKVLMGADFRETYLDFLDKIVEHTLAKYASKELHAEDWDLASAYNTIAAIGPIQQYLSLEEVAQVRSHDATEEMLKETLRKAYEAREVEVGAEMMRSIERWLLLQVIENRWIEHLETMDYLREGIGLRAYGQVDPIVAYQKEAFGIFDDLLAAIRDEAVHMMFLVQVAKQPVRASYRVVSTSGGDDGDGAQRRSRQKTKKVGRNDPCPCGSGKKYKKCCLLKEGAVAE